MSAPTLTIDSATGGVKIAWTQPHDGSDTITSYTIEILQYLAASDAYNTGVYATELTECDGSDSTIVANLYCVVSMDTLITTHGYEY
jgi:hypothetical protein